VSVTLPAFATANAEVQARVSEAKTAAYSTLLVIAKQLVPGRVKTRIASTIGDERACQLAQASLVDTFHTADQAGAVRRVVAVDGEATHWVPVGWTTVQQGAGGLDRRLATAFAQVAAQGPAFLIGMDTPQVNLDQLVAFDPKHYDACLGPCVDGGYWGIGLRDPRRGGEVIHDVPMSTERTYDLQLERLRAAGMRVQILSILRDVDTFSDAVAVAEYIPQSHFGRAVRFMADVSLACVAVR